MTAREDYAPASHAMHCIVTAEGGRHLRYYGFRVYLVSGEALSYFTIFPVYGGIVAFGGSPRHKLLLVPTVCPATQTCLDYCVSSGAAYFGLQWGIECWCGQQADDYTRHGVDDCDFACGGDNGVTCGGYDKMDIFEIDY